MTLTDPKGYMSNMQSPAIGSETCPWRIIARPGQSIELKIIVINSESTLPTTSDDMVVCSAVIVVNDEFVGVKEFNICAAGKNRERQLFTSSGRELTVHWTSGSQQETSPRFIMSYDGMACMDCYSFFQSHSIFYLILFLSHSVCIPFYFLSHSIFIPFYFLSHSIFIPFYFYPLLFSSHQ